ncbi:MAG: hypothetical protein LBE48_00185 [Methanomassiliicoccaceae archaeon]|nr:hypothetical protein [Methanomassiliicoccaceae archaeon]
MNGVAICFLHVQHQHIGTKYSSSLRCKFSMLTMFKILDRLTCPAGADIEVMAVYDRDQVCLLQRFC